MKWLTTARSGAALLGCLLLVTAAGWADSHARIVRLSYLQGTVEVNRGQGMSFERAILNMPLIEGAQIRTGNGGAAEIEFEDGSTLRLAPDSRVECTALSLRDSGARVSTLDIAEGTVYVNVPHLEKGDEFTLQFPNRDLTLTHSVRMRVDVDAGQGHVAVFKGELELAGAGRTLKKNQTLSFDLGGANNESLANSVQPDAYDAWDKERTRIHDEGLTYSSQGGYSSGYGLASLAYYGNTFPLGGCGYGWQPYGVGLNWDPWSQGAWMWYPGSGYVWVSNSPWGFAPYRFGSWSFINGRGWTWCSPNGSFMTWPGWVAAPAILYAPPGYARPHAPLTIATGNGTTVWVGKGGPGGREGQLAGNSLIGDGGGGRGRQPLSVANSSVVFNGYPRTAVSSRGAGRSGVPSDSMRSNPRDQQAGSGRSNNPAPTGGGSRGADVQGRWQQAPSSRTDTGRYQAPPSRTDSPRYSAPSHMDSGRMSAPAPSAPMSSPHMSAPSAPSSAPAAASHPKQ